MGSKSHVPFPAQSPQGAFFDVPMHNETQQLPTPNDGQKQAMHVSEPSSDAEIVLGRLCSKRPPLSRLCSNPHHVCLADNGEPKIVVPLHGRGNDLYDSKTAFQSFILHVAPSPFWE